MARQLSVSRIGDRVDGVGNPAFEPGEVFVALKTGGGDGHQYIGDAIAGGATGVMCTNPPSIDTQGVTIIVMRSVEDALMRWAQLALRKYGTTVIAVTGSAGKSTTKEAIAQVLGTRYRVYKSDSSVSGRLSLPLALGRLTQDYPLAVLEFGIDQPGEMAALIEGAQPAAGVVTSIGHAHTDQLFSPEIIAREKGELIRALPSDGLAVLNFDDPLAGRSIRFWPQPFDGVPFVLPTDSQRQYVPSTPACSQRRRQRERQRTSLFPQLH